MMKKLSKYKVQETEIDRRWGIKTSTIVEVIGAVNRKKAMEKLQGVQEIVLLSTVHILRRALFIK